MTWLCLLLPVIAKFSLNSIRNTNDKHLFENLLNENEISSKNDDKLSRKIALITNNTERILHYDQLKVFGIFDQHKLICKRLTCFCKFAIIKCNDDTHFLLNSDILKRYVRYLIRTELFYSNLNEKIDRLIFFIRYLLRSFDRFLLNNLPPLYSSLLLTLPSF